MKLAEIKKDESYEKYLTRAERLGIKRLGSGSHATVFQHPYRQNIAVKIFTDDPAFITYMEFCLQNRNNPYLPKFYPVADGSYVKRIKDRTNLEIFVVFTKKYNHPKLSDIDKLYDYFFPDKSQSNDAGFWDRLTDEDWDRAAARLRTSDPYASELANFFANYAEQIDIGLGNVMYDPSTKYMIFTDPIA